MIIAGPCLINDEKEGREAIELARQLKERGLADMFRVKIWGGGTTPERYKPGMGVEGIDFLKAINEIIPCGTEIQTHDQFDFVCHAISWLWIGARNSQNYGLFKDIKSHKETFIKRSPGMTIFELIGIYDILTKIHKMDVYVIERGINTFDRQEWSRWSPDLKGAIWIKNERLDIFERYVVDCSHSVGIKAFVEDTYKAFKAIGVKHFMFECTFDGKSQTDQNHMLSIDELEKILKGENNAA